MAHAWNGSDPTQSADSGSYELGVEYVADSPVTVSAVRVWAGATPGAVASRRGRVWTTGGSLLGSAAMPTNLPSGWSEHPLDAPIDLVAGQHVVISYTTGGFYGELNHALDSAVVSADGLVTAVAGPAGVHGNGAFTTSVTLLPDHASGQNTFYGIDMVYTATGGNTPPSITAMTVTAVGRLATTVITATDTETLAGATYTVDWGDGTSPVSGAGDTQQHTYATVGTYAILGSVTDAGGLTASAARPITLTVLTDIAPGFDAQVLTDAIGAMAQSSGLFGAVSYHEPASLPANGINAAVWMQGIGPLKKLSGLSATAARVEYRMRLYTPMTVGDMDAIDPAMTTAASLMIRLLSADFTLGGEVFAADLLGLGGVPLSAKADNYKQGDALYRIYDITIPLLVDNVWAQEAAA